MNLPSPAIVAQNAVRRLPRSLLLAFCVTWVLAGFIGRGPWKNADISAFGYMLELARGNTDWLHPTLGGFAPETDGLLPYWLGAWALKIAPAWLPPDFVARVPFGILLALTLTATWYAVYALARHPGAQPVAFAFGGEALPKDYGRAIADGGLLALIACLGLAQLAHEGTAYLTQLAFCTLTFLALASAPWRPLLAINSLAAGLAGLVLSGAPALAVMFGAGGALLAWLESRDSTNPPEQMAHYRRSALVSTVFVVLAAALAWGLGLWKWRVAAPQEGEWGSLGRLLLWFTWPCWPLAILTLWRWRRHWAGRTLHRHLLLPIGFAVITIAATLTTQPADRALLLGLPALAALAAFSLPTLSRSFSALIDWFTLLFFTGGAIIIWVIYLAMLTGWPRQPAANVAKLAPGFVANFSWPTFLVALVATIAWGALVWWRAGRQRHALWKSLVLPAGGAGLGWLLLMTLWLPLLDYARSYAPQVDRIVAITGPDVCVEFEGFSRAQIAAFLYHGRLRMAPLGTARPRCDWAMANVDGADPSPATRRAMAARGWKSVAQVPRPADRRDTVELYRRTAR
ncbi:hypothetical protein [Xylophilus sp. GOD-11R]|uniref:hypothetical protein n=1 Tax=Xylophilus sp. GOD-11R TaxID=3089814 RepID=UPI00298CBC35|nr:hypothetical protein [Xylophilus sp. GOD-11R]WPB58714.1 hypothetical protein R9X41_08775 [Xylophilus sp. GOD-11R]